MYSRIFDWRYPLIVNPMSTRIGSITLFSPVTSFQWFNLCRIRRSMNVISVKKSLLDLILWDSINNSVTSRQQNIYFYPPPPSSLTKIISANDMKKCNWKNFLSYPPFFDQKKHEKNSKDIRVMGARFSVRGEEEHCF